MANYQELKQAIADVIKTNGNQEITGAILQNVLKSIVYVIGENATFAGIATPETNPGTPDQNIFYIASENGVYTNFNAIELNDEVAILSNESGIWKKSNTNIANSLVLNKLFVSKQLQDCGIINNKNILYKEEVVSVTNTVNGIYSINGTLKNYPTYTTNVLEDISFGDVYKIGISTYNYDKELCLIGFWKDNSLVDVYLSSDAIPTFANKEIYVAVPINVNKMTFLGNPIKKVIGLKIQDDISNLENKISTFNQIRKDIEVLDIEINNLAYSKDLYQKGIDSIGKIVNIDWQLCVAKVEPNTKYYIKSDIYAANLVGKLGYSDVYPNISMGGIFDSIDMLSLPDENGYKYFETESNANYLIFNLKPFNNDIHIFIGKEKNNEVIPVSTIGERYIFDILQVSIDKFKDKVLCIFGDSITYLSKNDGLRGWVTYFKRILKFKEVRIYARSGATWSCTENTVYDIVENTGLLSDNNVIYNQVNRLIDDVDNKGMLPPDFIIAFAGTNDAWYPSARPNAFSDTAEEIFVNQINVNYLDDVNINTCTSIAKAIRYFSEMIISKYPNCNVMLGSPLQSTVVSLDRINKASEIIEQCANYMSYIFINQSKECSISKLQELKGFYKTYDGTHTSEIGAEDVGKIVAAKFNSSFN